MKSKITFLRTQLGITQEELAKKASVTRQTIIALEQGKYNPSLILAYKITKVLGQKKIEDVFDLRDEH